MKFRMNSMALELNPKTSDTQNSDSVPETTETIFTPHSCGKKWITDLKEFKDVLKQLLFFCFLSLYLTPVGYFRKVVWNMFTTALHQHSLSPTVSSSREQLKSLPIKSQLLSNAGPSLGLRVCVSLCSGACVKKKHQCLLFNMFDVFSIFFSQV